MAQRHLSVYLFMLVANLAPTQVSYAQITVDDVTALTTATTTFTPSLSGASVVETTSRSSEGPEIKETTAADVEQSTRAEVQQTTTENMEGNTTADVKDNVTATVKSTPALIDTGSLSKSIYDDFKDSSVYFQFIFVSLGVVANIFNITVFTQKRMRSATSTILTFLSCSELGAAICELIMTICTGVLGHRTYTSKIFWTLFQWSRVYLTVVFQRSSFCFNIIVATERFIAVKFPLKAKHILNRRNPVVFCAVTFVIVFGFHIYNPLKMKVVGIDTRRGVIYTIRNSELYTNTPVAFDVLSLFTKILFSYLPLFGCLLMNILMVLALWSHRKEQKGIQSTQDSKQQNEKRQTQTTITVLVSTFLFVLLSLPVTTSTIAQTTIPQYGLHKQEHYLFRFITLFGGLLYLLSLSMDFLVYMILSRAFRDTFVSLARAIFRCKEDRSAIRSTTAGTRSTGLSSESGNKSGGDIALSTVCKFENQGFGSEDAASKYEVNGSSRDSQTSDAGNQTDAETK